MEERHFKAYVLLEWYWDKDGFLCSSYCGVFKNNVEALNHRTDKEAKYYLHGERIPKEEEGDSKSPAFYQIVEKEL